MEVRALAHAGEALGRVEAPLASAGAEGELSFGILRRLVDEPDAYGDVVTVLLGLRAGEPAALVTMTGEHPALIVGFLEDPAGVGFADLVRAMLAAGRRPRSVNGARRWSEPFARAWAEVAGAAVRVAREMRAFELRTLRPPRLPEGRCREATDADAPLLERWIVAFGEDIDEPVSAEDAAHFVARACGARDAAVWEQGGRPVSVAVVGRRTPWSSSIGPVYTPPELRGRGFASAVVAALSQRELDAGQRWCSLFTDLANATSNHIYTDLGYEPRCDFRLFELGW
jgi:GNAT superfamily N-acetyltransferase